MGIKNTKETKYYIVIPAYNEEQVIESVIDELYSAGHKNIIVVDDGSTDNTYRKAAEKKIVLLRHILNRGKGAAIKTGLEAARLLNAEHVVTFDADGQHDPNDIRQMIKLLDDYDVVLGQRNFSDKQIPFFKRMGNFVGNLVTWVVYGLWVADSQSGMRAYSKKALVCMETTADRYEYDSEILREIVRNKLSYIETPIHVRYTTYSQKKADRQTYMGAVKTVIRMMLAD